jgi:hypothetical protein
LALLAFLASLVALSPPTAVAYRCLDDSKFTLVASPTLAVVRFSDREYRLPRRPSSLAIKYESTAATLFLDGEFAAFIAEDRPLPGCYRDKPGKRR